MRPRPRCRWSATRTAAGKQVHVWTVNTPEAMLRMIERGVDNIITDDPVLLVRVMNERQSLSRARNCSGCGCGCCSASRRRS